MNSFLRLSAKKGLLLYLIFFACREQMDLVLTAISQEVLLINQVVKSCFEVLCWKSFDHTFYSEGEKQFSICL